MRTSYEFIHSGMPVAHRPGLKTAIFAALTLLISAGAPLGAQTAIIALSPGSLAFPVTVKGKPSAPQVVTVTSYGNTAVSLTSFAIAGADAADFAITAKTCGAVVASAASCQISITFTPAATGARTATLTVTDSASNSPQTVALSGNGSNIVFTLRPAAIEFPVVTVGSSNTSQVTVTNIGIESATISSIALSGGDVTDFVIGTKTCGATLAAGASCTVNVSFTPKVDGIRTSNLLFTDTASQSPQAVPLTGTAQASTQTLIFSPTALIFNASPTGVLAPVVSVSVANYGAAPVTFTTTAITGANPSDFVVIGDNCSPLASAQSCSVAVGFRPLAPGLRTAVLLVYDTAAGSPQSVPLSGTGVASGSLLTFSPATLAFPPENIGASANASFTVQNFGTTGAVFSSYAISGKNASDFFIIGNSCPTGSAALNPGQTCSVSVTFKPTAAGLRAATLSITDSAIGSPQLVPLSGTGQSLSKQLVFSTGILTFGNQTVGTNSGTSSLSVQNLGDATVTLSSVVLGGTNAGDFHITSSSCYAGTTIGPNATCGVYFTFTPSAAGVRAATLTFTDDAVGSPQSVTLEGVGDTAAQQLSFNYVTLDFGVLDIGSTSSQKAVNIFNAGDQTVSFSSVVITGTNAPDFTVTSDSCFTPSGLSPGNTCQIYVNFIPSATGERTAQLIVTDSATGSPEKITLNGVGQALTEFVTFTYPSLVFAAQAVGSTSGENLEYFNNTGDSPIVVSSVSITGGNASDFAIVTDTCPIGGTGVGPGTYCYVYVTFTPVAAGLRTSTLQFVDSATGSPHNVPLVGVGTPAVVPLSLNPTDVAFNDQNVGITSAAMNVNISNPGSKALSLSIALTGANAGDFAILTNTCPASLGAGGSCNVGVTFKPTALGSRVAALQTTAGGTVVDVGLSGIGTTGAMVLTTAGSAVDFGAANIASTSAQFSVLVSNTGTETVTFTSFSLGGADPHDFTIASNQCGTTLAVGSACSVFLTFTPVAAGVRTATLQIADNAMGSPQSVPLSGVGQTATVALAIVQPFAFGATNIGTTLSQYMYVTSLGTAPVTISNISLAGANAGDFTIGQNNCIGSPVNPGSQCYFYISFTPTAAGVRTATAQLTDNAVGSPQSVALDGIGQAVSFGLELPQALALPLTLVGTTSQSNALYVTNTGTAPVTLNSVTIAGTNASEFSFSGASCVAGEVIQPGSACYLYVSFAPTAAGNATAAVQFSDNAAGSPQTFALSGVGLAATLALSLPPLIVLPNTTLGAAFQSGAIYVYNVGTETVTLTNVVITGTNASEFAITGGNCTAGTTVASGGYCYLYVTFTPTAIGNATAAVQFTDNATGSPQSITLSGVGQGLTATAALDPSLLAFGGETVGSTSSQMLTYLYNTGSSVLTITGASIAGANAGDFSINQTSCVAGTQIAPGGNCYAYVQFTPTAKGARMAALQITDNAVGGTQSAMLTGIGQ